MNAHLIKITFLGPTNSRGARVKLTSQRFEKDSVTFQYPYSSGTFESAAKWLREHGYTIVCSGEMPDAYWAAVADFRPLKDAAKGVFQARDITATKVVNRQALRRLRDAVHVVASLLDDCPSDEVAIESVFELERAAAAIGE